MTTPDFNNVHQISFFSGNPYVDVTKGVVHFCKVNKKKGCKAANKSEMLCILSVPTSMTIHDLLQFTGPVSENVEHIRIVRNTKPNQYMALLKFCDQKSSDEFYENFNKVQFNSIEPEICHLLYVKKVETANDSKDGNGSLAMACSSSEPQVCAVCLEKMDESAEGTLTILCNHTFHFSCLGKWTDSSCPVCRYQQVPESVQENHCFKCGSQESLWICVICGNIGCGRYVEGHAKLHYQETQHTYALEIGADNRVWDYAGDNYVHRLLQNKTDGKPVAVESDNNMDDKVDSIQLEYTYILSNQLEAQRHYFEETINRIESEAREHISEILDKNKVLLEDKERLEEESERISKEKASMEKKINQLSTRLGKVFTDLQEEKEISKCLGENQELWSKKLQETEKQLRSLIEKKDQEISELKDQVRDLMFFLEAQNKLKDVAGATEDEIKDSHVVVGSSPSTSKPRRSRKK
ncbi:BRCA1-associated protein [Brevipalpus obovatus]|uniref:BRCA1-associated protein n=1 Tax=Brevipalpus obovatus TaxID=246614 RepID=UPI003D9F4733